METIKYDEISEETEFGWFLTINGKDHFLPYSRCEIDENKKTIDVPEWLVEREGLEAYVI